MSKKVRMPEKLIEELGGILYGLYNLIPEMPKGRSIEEAITCIGNAVLSGKYPELDEVFGVVGRFETEGELGEKVLRRALNILARQGATEFIALPRQMAPGEEEE